MATGNLLTGIIAFASALAGGLLVVLALMTAFAAMGRMLLLLRRVRVSRKDRATGHTHRREAAASGAAVAAD